MSFVIRCWWKGARSGRSPKSWGFRGLPSRSTSRSGAGAAGDPAAGRPVWETVGARVDALLAESAGWTGGKQQLTATRLHELLVAEGHRVGVTLVKEAVAEWRRQRREVFVPLTYRPGTSRRSISSRCSSMSTATRRKAWLFLMRLMDSGPRLRLDLPAAGPDQLPGWPRSRLRALRRRARARGVRQSQGGGRADPRRRRADADAAVRRPGLALSARAMLLSPGRRPRQGRGRGARQGGAPPGAQRRFHARPHSTAINQALLARDGRAPATRPGLASARQSGPGQQ